MPKPKVDMSLNKETNPKIIFEAIQNDGKSNKVLPVCTEIVVYYITRIQIYTGT